MMEDTKRIPLIIFACANILGREELEGRLRQKHHEIARALRMTAGEDSIETIVEDPGEGKFLIDTLRQHAFQDRDILLHISGPAKDGPYLTFRSAFGEERVLPDILGAYFNRLPGLRLVFLAGPGKQEMLEKMLLRDIPVVASLPFPGEGDEGVLDPVRRYYLNLVEGKSLLEAWESLPEADHEDLPKLPADYDLDTDTLTWPGKEAGSPHGFIFLDDSSSRLSWRLLPPVGAEQPMPAAPAGKIESKEDQVSTPPVEPEAPEPAPKRGTSRTIWAIILGLLVGSAAFIIWKDPFNWRLFLQPYISQVIPGACPFNSPDSYHVLLQTDSEAGTKGELGPVWQYLDSVARSDPKVEVLRTEHTSKQVANNCKVHLNIWGEWSDTMLTLHYRCQSAGNNNLSQIAIRIEGMSQAGIDLEMRRATRGIFESCRGYFALKLGEYDDAAQFFQANLYTPDSSLSPDAPALADAYANSGNYESALLIYHQILSQDPENARALNGRGNVFYLMREYEKALADFDRAILLNPELGAAYLNRGKVLWHLQEFSTAVPNVTRATELNPDDPMGYAILAAIYADMGNREQTFYFLEQAFKHGFEFSQNYDLKRKFKHYRSEPEYKALMDRYL